ncbi:MAG TPA: DUF6622 family protein [Bradyrhizobium sp.]|nr:DUF6622 family protein [Bradyrhizobium sp.]
MTVIVNILAHTPPWVFPLIAAVIWLGSIGLYDRAVPLLLLFVLPVVLLAMSIATAIGTSAPPLAAASGWVAAAAVGGLLGWSSAEKPREIDPMAARIIIPGSPIPLIVCIAIVTWRYLFGYLYGRYPALLANERYALAFIAGTALLAGVMFGRLCRYGAWYWRRARPRNT